MNRLKTVSGGYVRILNFRRRMTKTFRPIRHPSCLRVSRHPIARRDIRHHHIRHRTVRRGSHRLRSRRSGRCAQMVPENTSRPRGLTTGCCILSEGRLYP